jgi:hypothetical protein
MTVPAARKSPAVMAVLAGACAISAARAGVTESHWISDNEDCDFLNPINWSGPVPDETVSAIFDLETTIGLGPFVCFDFNEASSRMIVRAGHPEFIMFQSVDGEQVALTYELLSDEVAAPSLVVGESAGQDVSFRVLNGHIVTGSTVIGLAAGSIGAIQLDTRFDSSMLDGSLSCANRLYVGDGGTGSVGVNDRVAISCGTAQLGVQGGSHGEIILNNPDVSL